MQPARAWGRHPMPQLGHLAPPASLIHAQGRHLFSFLYHLPQLLSSPELEATTSLVHNGLAFTAMAFVPSTAILVPEGACVSMRRRTASFGVT